jgi:two-component system, cell cycle sensor histidine kinase and response regulator CckA
MTGFPFLSDPRITLFVASGLIVLLLFAVYRLQRRSLLASRRAEQQQADAENRFTLAFQQNTVPMCISEWDGTIRDVNQVFCEISGYAPDELVGRNSIAMGLWCRPEEQRTRMVAMLQQHGRVRDIEVEFHNKAGAIVPALLSVSLLTIDGTSCLLSNIHDLTAAKEMEEKSRKLEQQMAQAKNLEAMGALVGGLAHQFNNILTGIIGYGELALDDVDANAQLAGDLEKILAKAAEAKQLVQQILSFSREQVQVEQRINLVGFVEDIVQEMRKQVPEGLRVEGRLSGGPVWVVADPVNLQLAILNICRNAIESMPEGGVLIVGLQYPSGAGERFADVDADLPAGEYAHLFVKDKGQGMDHLTLERIFNPFFTTKQPGQGTGMGLSVAYGIIHAHGGIIRVNSRKGYGSTFHLFFPVVGGVNEQPI